MAYTIRLGPRSERQLSALAKRRQQSRSDIVREAIARYDADSGGEIQGGGPYEAWLDVIGVVNLGTRNVLQTTGEQFGDLLRQKSARRRRAR